MRKKLFAVIMSVMMMVTFMPAMAFAASYNFSDVTNWQDYSKATVKFVNASDSTDTYTKDIAVARTARLSGSTGSQTFEGHIDAYVEGYKNQPSANASYYDFDCAEVSKLGGLDISSGRITLAEAKSIFGSEFTKDVSATQLTFSVPSYVDNKSDVANTTTGAKVAGLTADIQANVLSSAGFDFKVSAPAYDKTNMYQDQTFDIVVKQDFKSNHEKSIGHVKTIKLTIVKEKATAEKATYTFDGEDTIPETLAEASAMAVYYDGAEHTIAQAEIPGVSSTYELYNKETGKYETVSSDSVVVKNADTYEIKATAKDSEGKTKEHVFKFVVKPSTALNYGFKVNDARSIYETSTTQVFEGFYVGSNYAEKDFVKVYPYDITTTPDNRKQAAAAEKAVEADNEQIMALFDEVFEFKTEESKNQEGIFNSKINWKDLTDTEEKAVLDKYEELLANYAYYTSATKLSKSVARSNYTTQFFVKDEVKFTKAPLNKTYKAKKGKLAKSKKFTVKAKSLSGAKVTYKLYGGGSRIVINKNTGKVTLKKGLKKRTYNVTIRATAGEYIGTTEDVTVRIKVK